MSNPSSLLIAPARPAPLSLSTPGSNYSRQSSPPPAGYNSSGVAFGHHAGVMGLGVGFSASTSTSSPPLHRARSITRNQRFFSASPPVPPNSYFGASGGHIPSGSRGKNDGDDSPTTPSAAELNMPIHNLHPVFTPRPPNNMPGKVKIIVESTTFYCHKEVLVFGSTFFEGILVDGGWKENVVGKAGTSRRGRMRGNAKGKERALEPEEVSSSRKKERPSSMQTTTSIDPDSSSEDETSGPGRPRADTLTPTSPKPDAVVSVPPPILNVLEPPIRPESAPVGIPVPNDEGGRRGRKPAAKEVVGHSSSPTGKKSIPAAPVPQTLHGTASFSMSSAASMAVSANAGSATGVSGTGPPFRSEKTRSQSHSPNRKKGEAHRRVKTLGGPRDASLGFFGQLSGNSASRDGESSPEEFLEPEGEYDGFNPSSATAASIPPAFNDSNTIFRYDRIRNSTASLVSTSIMSADSYDLDYPEEDDEDELVEGLEAKIVLKEEKAVPFQDLLFFIYPNLECVVTWNNAPDLMTMAMKFDMPMLKRHCTQFLVSSAAGKPIQAMKIAEDHQIPDLYKEASRFLLDNYTGWDQNELNQLSESTLLKLEKKRNWFLERLLKLGLVNSARDYVCSPNCPDPQNCAKLVDDKWRSAWNAAFRFGPPQPSIIYRSLRQLEPSLSSPALHLPHTSCQAHCRAWVADLFDRMFSLGTTRGWGGGFAGLGFAQTYSRTYGLYGVGGAGSIGGDTAGGGTSAKGAKYFLYITLYGND